MPTLTIGVTIISTRNHKKWRTVGIYFNSIYLIKLCNFSPKVGTWNAMIKVHNQNILAQLHIEFSVTYRTSVKKQQQDGNKKM